MIFSAGFFGSRLKQLAMLAARARIKVGDAATMAQAS
jgi:hypothetical protein